MNREIEFRGKSKIDYETDNGFVYGYYFRSYGCKNGVKSYADFIFDCEKELYYPIDINTLGQYTGLKDRNGVKIFEGDIVEYDYELYVVKFENGCFNFCQEFANYNDWIQVSSCEVIGNIYENKELLGDE